MWLCFGVIVACGWAYVAALSSFGLSTGLAGDLLRSLCLADGDPWSRQSLSAAGVMWGAMVLAMMLPSAAPMLATYMDIAEAAAEKSMTIASPAVLGAGYLSVWLGFSIGAATLQAWLQTHAILSADEVLTSPLLAGLLLIGAGAYQFSDFKHACLHKCAHPMPWFMANWRDDIAGVFALGLRQGGFCVACCWAMMLVMFVAGLMNLFWMAAIGLVMILEKTLANPKPVSYGTGVLLIVAGAGVISVGTLV